MNRFFLVIQIHKVQSV